MRPTCEICGCDDPLTGRVKLYGHNACYPCGARFANRRQAAFLVDFSLFASACAFFLLVETVPWLIVQSLLFELAGYVCALAFFFRDGFRGQSPGKWLTGVRVYSEESGEPIGIGQSILRNLPLLIIFPLFVIVYAGTMMRGKHLGDWIAGTKVVWLTYADHPVFAVGVTHDPSNEKAPVGASWDTPPVPYIESENPYQATLA